MGLAGFIEIACPCCNRYKHVREEELAALQNRRSVDETEIICPRCWGIVAKVMERNKMADQPAIVEGQE